MYMLGQELCSHSLFHRNYTTELFIFSTHDYEKNQIKKLNSVFLFEYNFLPKGD